MTYPTAAVCRTKHWPDHSGLPYRNIDHESRVSVVLRGSAVSSPRCAKRTLRNPQTAHTTIPLWGWARGWGYSPI